jgi:hypothetical protein
VRGALVALAAAAATLAFAGAAFAANTGSITVWHSPMVLAGSQSTTFHITVPQSTDPIAATTIYVPHGYGANVSQPAGTTIGTVAATAFARDDGLTLPLSGTVVAEDPAAYTASSAVCAGIPASQAVWILNLSVLGTTLPVPLYVNPTAGPARSLGDYTLSICLPPPDVAAGTPGRAFHGAQLLDSLFTVNGVFTTPTAGGLLEWETLFTPYNPGRGTPNPAGTFEARAFVPLPIIVHLTSTYSRKTRMYTLTGRMSEGGLPAAGLTVAIARGPSAKTLKSAASVKTGRNGTFKLVGRLKPRRTTFFRASAFAPEDDYTAQGCKTPAVAFAPAGCVKAALSPWTATSATVRVRS